MTAATFHHQRQLHPSVIAPLVAVGATLLLLVTPGHAASGSMQGSPPAQPLGPLELELAFPNLPLLPRMTHLTHAGDGADRLWAVLKDGRIMVFANDPRVASAETFLDIRDRVLDSAPEEGLLGLAFDPDYPSNGYFYVNYTAPDPRHTVVSRFSVSASDPNRADPASELVLLQVPQPYPNHNGGTLTFGPDGYLYVGLGDGGSGGDPLGHGQNTRTLLGTILRLDVRDATAQEPYRIPPDNPFASAQDGSRPEIWAYGLRNPWKFSFDPATGVLWAADVGQSAYEEVDIILPGRNYGWNLMEGLHCYPPGTPTCDQAGLEPPIWEYAHDQGCSITGGYVYRGQRLPQLTGAYIYADFCSGRIWGLRYDGSRVTQQALLADTNLRIPSFGLDAQGQLFILDFNGRIYRFQAPAPPTPTATPTPTSTSTPTPAATSPPPTRDITHTTASPTPTSTASPTLPPPPTTPGAPFPWPAAIIALAAAALAAYMWLLRHSGPPHR